MAMAMLVPELECKGRDEEKEGAVLVQEVAERFEAVALVLGVERERGAIAMAEGLQRFAGFVATSFAVRSIDDSPGHEYLRKER